IFCTPQQLMGEVKGAIELALYFSEVLGIDEISYRLSKRDDMKEKWLGTEEASKRAQDALAEAPTSMGQTYQVGVGGSAFYGPQIDFQAGVISVNNRAGERTQEPVEAFVERVTREIADRRR